MTTNKDRRFVARCLNGQAVVVDTEKNMIYRGFESMQLAKENAANRNARESNRK